mmetsp:Transcript_32516/g.107195  ORF Transcript_32516/g.107195 Transcript_32516/m.107195 type:complete len:1005 (+) Transcript_32516:85-3099(+)
MPTLLVGGGPQPKLQGIVPQQVLHSCSSGSISSVGSELAAFEDLSSRRACSSIEPLSVRSSEVDETRRAAWEESMLVHNEDLGPIQAEDRSQQERKYPGSDDEAEQQPRHRRSLSSECSTNSFQRAASKWQMRRGSTKRHGFDEPKTTFRCLYEFFAGLQNSWQSFSLFGVHPAANGVWGVPKAKLRHPGGEPGGDAGIMKLVKQHLHGEEMRMQLRDERVRLTYFDAFDSIGDSGARFLVRVFSVGAAYLEYLKIFLAIWTFFVTLAVVAFWEVLRPMSSEGLVLGDLCVDVLYALCLMMQLRTTILDVESGYEVCGAEMILKANLKDVKFWIDALSCVPFVLLDCGQQCEGRRPLRVLLFLPKALRGLRVFRIPPEHRFVPSTPFMVVQLSCIMLMGGHLLACAWFVLSHDIEDTLRYHLQNRAGMEALYGHCLQRVASSSSLFCFFGFYAMALNTGVYLMLGFEKDAQSALEHIFVTICAPGGVLVTAYVFGRVVLLLQRSGALETKRSDHMLALQDGMRVLGLPSDMRVRIFAFTTYEQIHRSGGSFADLFADLPAQLRFELQLHLYLELVGRSRLFRSTRPCVIREIVVQLEDSIFLPGDWIVRCGDYGDSMYFVVRGTCTVFAKDTVTELKQLKRGDYFGEVALLMGLQRTAYVRANTFCIMASLTKDGFYPILKKWPEEIDVLTSGVEKEADREKIKAQALKQYGLHRRPSKADCSSRTSPQAAHSPRRPSRAGLCHFEDETTSRPPASPDQGRRRSAAEKGERAEACGPEPLQGPQGRGRRLGSPRQRPAALENIMAEEVADLPSQLVHSVHSFIASCGAKQDIEQFPDADGDHGDGEEGAGRIPESSSEVCDGGVRVSMMTPQNFKAKEQSIAPKCPAPQLNSDTSSESESQTSSTSRDSRDEVLRKLDSLEESVGLLNLRVWNELKLSRGVLERGLAELRRDVPKDGVGYVWQAKGGRRGSVEAEWSSTGSFLAVQAAGHRMRRHSSVPSLMVL